MENASLPPSPAESIGSTILFAASAFLYPTPSDERPDRRHPRSVSRRVGAVLDRYGPGGKPLLRHRRIPVRQGPRSSAVAPVPAAGPRRGARRLDARGRGVRRHRALPDIRTTGRCSQRAGLSDAMPLRVPVGGDARRGAPRDGTGGRRRWEVGAGGWSGRDGRRSARCWTGTRRGRVAETSETLKTAETLTLTPSVSARSTLPTRRSEGRARTLSLEDYRFGLIDKNN